MSLRKVGKKVMWKTGRADKKGGAKSYTNLKTLSCFGQISTRSPLRASVCLQ